MTFGVGLGGARCGLRAIELMLPRLLQLPKNENNNNN